MLGISYLISRGAEGGGKVECVWRKRLLEVTEGGRLWGK